MTTTAPAPVPGEIGRDEIDRLLRAASAGPVLASGRVLALPDGRGTATVPDGW